MGALHHPAQHSMAWHGALSAFLELMGWLFQPCRDPAISYWHRFGLLARAFGEGSGVGEGRVIHQPRRFWMTWQARRIATPSSRTAGTGLQPLEGVKGNGTLEGTPESQGTQDTCPVMLLSPPKATVPLGTGSTLQDDADRWEWVTAKRLRNYFQAGKVGGPRSDLSGVHGRQAAMGRRWYPASSMRAGTENTGSARSL